MPINVLLVDDSQTVRDVIARTLRISGVPVNEIHHAANGKEGLDLLKSNWVDLVFADINMPVMDGVEMIGRMAMDGLLSTVPVIIVSTEGSVTRIEEIQSMGVKAFVRKPFTPEIIRSVVQDVLGVSAQSKEEVVERVFVEVLERFAFMFAEASPDPAPPPPNEDFFVAGAEFSGPLSGRIMIAIPLSLSVSMAANVLGEEPGPGVGVAKAGDAVRELLSVTCGHLTVALAGARTVFRITPPDLEKSPPVAWKALASDRGSRIFSIEGAPLVLNLRIEEEDRC